MVTITLPTNSDLIVSKKIRNNLIYSDWIDPGGEFIAFRYKNTFPFAIFHIM
jgi:hypothetical protein